MYRVGDVSCVLLSQVIVGMLLTVVAFKFVINVRHARVRYAIYMFLALRCVLGTQM